MKQMNEGLEGYGKAAGALVAISGAVFAGIKAWTRFVAPTLKQELMARKIARELAAQFGPDAAIIIKSSLAKTNSAVELVLAKLGAVTRRVNVNLFLCDANGNTLWVNEPMTELFQLEQKDMLGYGWLKNVRDARTVHDNWKFCVENRMPYSGQYELQLPHVVRTVGAYAWQHYAEDGRTILFYIGYAEKLAEVPTEPVNHIGL